MASLILDNEIFYIENGYIDDGYFIVDSKYGKYELNGISRLTNQFGETPLIQGFVAAMLAPISDSELLADAVKNERWISTAIGKQLDGCGYIVGESRMGRDDDAYRAAILFRVFVNTSNATPSDLIHGLRYLTSPDDIQYIEQYPTTAMLFTDGPNVQDNIQTVMQDLSPAAISQVPIMVSFSRKSPFRFSKEPENRLLNVGEGTRLIANGNRISISPSEQSDNGPRLGGIAPAYITANGSKLSCGAGRLRINSPNHQTIIESGYHLVGVYQ